ncbi:MAG: preprotein translocase subunit SecE [Clostridium sp.]
MAKKKNSKEDKMKKNTQTAGIRNELKKVSWPNAEELSKATAAVMFLVVLVAIIIFVSDTIFSFGNKKFTKYVSEKNKKAETAQTQKNKNEQNKQQNNKK